MDQIATPHAGAVEEVVALPIALDAALDRHLVVVDRQPSGGVVEDHGHLGKRSTRTPLAADIDDLFHLAAADVARLAGAEHPLDGVDDVRLAGAVGADDGGDSAVELDLGLRAKVLKPSNCRDLKNKLAGRVADV